MITNIFLVLISFSHVVFSYTIQDMIEMMSGSGPASLAPDTLQASTYLATFSQCTSCPAAQPCASTESGYCMTPSQALYLDSEFHYCPTGTTCCVPELCAKPVSLCRFQPTAYLSTRLLISIEMDILREFNALAKTIQVQGMKLASTTNLSEQCTTECNGWNQGLGDISSRNCPVTCSCNTIAPSKLKPDAKYCCARRQVYTHDNDNIMYTTYHTGSRSVEILGVSNPIMVCKAEDECTDSNVCISAEAYNSLPQKDKQPSTSSSSEEGTGFSMGAWIGIAVAIAAIATIAIVIATIMWKRRHNNSETDAITPLL